MPHQRVLQAEADQRRAEQHGGVHVIAPPQREMLLFVQPATGEQQADGDVHQEEQQQEWLGTGEQLRRVGTQPPGEADAEGADEADQVERTPGLEPGDGEDAGIEQGEVAEQRDMAATAGGRQDRRGEAAQRRGRGEAEGILQHGEHARAERHQHQQDETGAGLDQHLAAIHLRVQPDRREHRQVQHRHAGPLQQQCVGRPAQAQPPAQAEQRQRRGGDADIGRLGRHAHAFGGIAQEEGQTEEQQHHADPQHGIAAQQPVAGGGEGALDGRRLPRFAGFLPGRFHRPGSFADCRRPLGNGAFHCRRGRLGGRQLDIPGQLRFFDGSRRCRWQRIFGDLLRRLFRRRLLDLQQTLMDSLGGRLEALDELRQLPLQRGVPALQIVQADSLPHRQPQ
ncbi:hypothetical protein D9M70_360760 [compost metagenome]